MYILLDTSLIIGRRYCDRFEQRTKCCTSKAPIIAIPDCRRLRRLKRLDHSTLLFLMCLVEEMRVGSTLRHRFSRFPHPHMKLFGKLPRILPHLISNWK